MLLNGCGEIRGHNARIRPQLNMLWLANQFLDYSLQSIHLCIAVCIKMTAVACSTSTMTMGRDEKRMKPSFVKDNVHAGYKAQSTSDPCQKPVQTS